MGPSRSRPPSGEGETAFLGVSAAPGVAHGPSVVLGTIATDDRVVSPATRPDEVQRAHSALEAAAMQLENIASRLHLIGDDAGAEIVQTSVLMARDPTLLDRVRSLVVDSGMVAPTAIQQAANRGADELATLADPTLALRADDVRSIGRRAAALALGATLIPGGVLVAESLGPADVADLGLGASGVALAAGSVTGHAAIVARSLGVPMVVGLGPEILAVRSGEEVVLDGDAGLLVRHPTRRRVSGADAYGLRRRQARDAARARRDEPAMTEDGHRVTVLANAATMAEVIEALEQGAEGIGLLRTELSFLDAAGWPSVGQQTNFLKPLLARLRGGAATVRLFDFGGDKTPPFLRGVTARGIELLLEAPDVLRDHVGAIIAAAVGVRLRLLIPMVTRPEQVRAVRKLLEGSDARLGAMIETPEAARDAAGIAKECDFLSLGTNDLTQLVLGLDREKSKTAPVTDIRVLRLVDVAVRAARARRIPVEVCGEAGSDPVAMPLLIGLGVDELSVAAARVGEVREAVRRLSFADCRRAAERKLLHQAGHAGRQSV
jgi:phosphoenolpyruvate-protein kinase (PTS system EI component)